MVVSAVRLAWSDNWRFSYVLRDCLELYTPDFEIVHGVRQIFFVADRLAALAYTHHQRMEFDREQDLPGMVRRWCLADKLELRNYRP